MSTSVTGNIGDLQIMPGLRNLYLNSTSVGGDIGDLKIMPRLRLLYLSRTSVEGDIATLKKMQELEKINFFLTDVHVKYENEKLKTIGTSIKDERLVNLLWSTLKGFPNLETADLGQARNITTRNSLSFCKHNGKRLVPRKDPCPDDPVHHVARRV